LRFTTIGDDEKLVYFVSVKAEKHAEEVGVGVYSRVGETGESAITVITRAWELSSTYE